MTLMQPQNYCCATDISFHINYDLSQTSINIYSLDSPPVTHSRAFSFLGSDDMQTMYHESFNIVEQLG